LHHSDNIFFHCSVPGQANPNPATYSIPGKKIIGDTLFSSLISRFAVYPWFTHIAVNGTPIFEQMRRPLNTNGRFQGYKLGLSPVSLIDPYFQKVKRVLKKVY
jgi:hypothetical protein